MIHVVKLIVIFFDVFILFDYIKFDILVVFSDNKFNREFEHEELMERM